MFLLKLFNWNQIFFCCGVVTQRGSWPPHSWGFLDHTQWRITVSKTPLDEWSARRIDIYLTTHNSHNRQISMPPVGLDPTISAGERQQTYALDRAATETGTYIVLSYVNRNLTLSETRWHNMSLVGTVEKHKTVFSIQYIRCATLCIFIATIVSRHNCFHYWHS